MQNSLYIFDIDGTLTDSIPTYIGLTDIDTDYDNYLHHTDRYALAYNYQRNFGKQITDELCQQVDILLEKELQKHPPAVEIKGAQKTLRALQKNDIPFAYGTGAFPKATAIKMNQAKLPLITEVLATSMHSETREGFVKHAITKAQKYYNQIDFARIIAVGDGLWDLKAAKNLGIEFIGVGLKNKQALIDAGCKLWIEDLSDFPIIQ